MRKLLPLLSVVAGLGVFAAAFIFIRRSASPAQESSPEEKIAAVIALTDRPFVSLTPSKDGHWLEMKIERIKIPASTMDYELLYRLPDGRTQGVPGTVNLKGGTAIERDLLLGSESSGKFRYDEGISAGTLTLRFRNSEGKLVSKFATDFHFQLKTRNLTSTDGKFRYLLDKEPGNEFFVTMETFGIPAGAPGEVTAGPYGVFKGVAVIKIKGKTLPVTDKSFPGSVKLSGASVYQAENAGWEKLSGGKSDDVGIFVGTSE